MSETHMYTHSEYWGKVREIATLQARIEALEVQAHSRNECVSDLEARIEALTESLRKISDIAETGNVDWVIEVAEAALLEKQIVPKVSQK